MHLPMKCTPFLLPAVFVSLLAIPPARAEEPAATGPQLTFQLSAQERARFNYKPDFDFDGDLSGS